MQLFEEVLNRSDSMKPANPPSCPSYLDTNTSPPGIAHVRSAIEAMKHGKAPGIDSLQTELLKADIITSPRLLTDFFGKIWEQEVVLKTGVKILYSSSQKGDRGNCDNWREITLLSVISKIFCRILLKGPMKRLLIQYSQKNKQGSAEEEVVWIRYLFYATF